MGKELERSLTISIASQRGFAFGFFPDAMNYVIGLIFWFMRKKLVGSYLVLTETSRA